MEKNQIIIAALCDHPEYFDQVVDTYFEEWSRPHGNTRESVVHRTKHAQCEEDVPQTLLALQAGKLVGIVSLWRNDLRTRQDLSPWLAGLIVDPACRGQGVGKLLQYAALKRLKALGYTHAHLTTDHENYYERTGWKFLEIAPTTGDKTTRVYQFNLADLPKSYPG